MANVTTQVHRDSDEVRREIEDTRSQMDDTVDELADRLSPGHIIDEAWERLRGRGDEGIGEVVKEHPIPVALVGVGLGWLAVEQATEPRGGRGDHATRRTYASAPERAGAETYEPYDIEGREDEESGPGLGERVGEAASSAKEGIASAAETVREKAGEAVDRAKETTGRMKDRRADDPHEESWTEEARGAGRKVRRGFWSMMEESPLGLGAVAFGIGLASGLSVPSTRAEDRMMGRTSDALEDEAKRVGRQTVRKAEHVAGEATAAALEEGGRVGEAAMEAGRRTAEEEGLTAEGLEREADEVRRRTAEQAREDARVKRPDEPRR